MAEIIFVIRQIGPYHHDRFQALAKEMPVKVIETRASDDTYSWNTTFHNANYKRIALPKNPVALRKVLRGNSVFICGWYDWEMLFVLLISVITTCHRIIISDSRAADAERVFWKEKVKSFILKFYNGALVAGKESADYLKQLGFKKRIEKPWDVIDESQWTPKEKVEKENYWVFPARLVEKKNHLLFLKCFAKMVYRLENPPMLYLCGDGPLESSIKASVEELELKHLVVFKGFLQKEEMIPIMQKATCMVLPSIYDQWGLVVNEALAAGTPVLISDNCGAKELIVNGENGFVLKVNDELELDFNMLNLLKEISISVPEQFNLNQFILSVKEISHVE